MSQLSIVIPVYNEKDFVEESLRRVCATKIDGVDSLEFLVVNDGSTDGTREILERLVQELPIRVIHHERNQGKGAAVRTGFREVKGDFAVIQDADLEYDPRDLNLLLPPLLEGKADAVYGSRFVGSEIRRLLYFWHHIGNRSLTFITNLVTNLNFTDMETCYKMFRMEKFRDIPLESNDFRIEPEMTIKAVRHRLRFYEVAISYSGRTYEEGKKIGWSDGFLAVFAILKFAFYHPNDSLKSSES